MLLMLVLYSLCLFCAVLIISFKKNENGSLVFPNQAYLTLAHKKKFQVEKHISHISV